MTQEERTHRTSGNPFTNGFPDELATLEVPAETPQNGATEKPAKPRRSKKVTDPAPVETAVAKSSVVEVLSPKEASANLPANPEDMTNNLLAEILENGDQMLQVCAQIKTAQTILSNPKAIALFINAVLQADSLAEAKLQFDQSLTKVRNDWCKLNLRDFLRMLEDWADKGDKIAAQILQTLAAYKKTAVDIVEPLWKLVTEIVRPANEAESYFHLAQLMKKLQDNGFVDFITPRKFYPEAAIVFGFGAYLPKRERGHLIPIIDAGWTFLKEAEKRAKERMAGQILQIEEMKTEADLNPITPEEARASKEGKLFLIIGNNGGVLYHIKDRKVSVEVSVNTFTRSSGFVSFHRVAEYWRDQTVAVRFERWLDGRVIS
jgi:hypothetical protein